MTIEEIKQYIKVDYDDDDLIIEGLYNASMEYLEPILNIKYDKVLYKNLCELLEHDRRINMINVYILAMVKEMYYNRGLTTEKASEKLKYTMSHIINSLQYSDWSEYNV